MAPALPLALGTRATPRTRARRGAATAVLACCLAGHAHAQQLHELLPTDGHDRHGWAVDVEGGRIVAGAPFEERNGIDSGAAFVFDAGTGALLHVLTPPDGEAGDRFGSAVAIHGSRIVVGAPGQQGVGGETGAAFLFDAASGALLQELAGVGTSVGDELGAAVALDGASVVVGAPGDRVLGAVSGSAQVFDAGSGAFATLLVPTAGADGDRFGASVAVEGGVALVGAPARDAAGIDSGAAYLFDTTSAAQLAQLSPGDGAAGDAYGSAVALAGGRALVGAPADDDNGDASGSAYLFDAGTAGQLFKLLPGDGALRDAFGGAVALSSTVAAVGAAHDDDLGTSSGSTYVFDPGTGVQGAKLLAPGGLAGDELGAALALDGATLAAGAPGRDVDDLDDGAAFTFDAGAGVPLLELHAPDVVPNAWFGAACGASNGRVLVGAQAEGTPEAGAGSATLYDATSGARLAKLLADDGAAGDAFGFALALAEDLAVVGARGADGAGSDSGAVYVFDASTGAQTAELTAFDAGAGHAFGAAVGADPYRIVVGAPFDDTLGPGFGSAYLYDASTLTLVAKLTTPDTGAGDFFGSAVDVGDLGVIVGATWEDDNGANAGAAYLFDSLTGVELAKLVASDISPNDHFGYRVAIGTSTALVSNLVGGVYLFDVVSYTEIAKLAPDDCAPCGGFGRSLAIDGEVAIVGNGSDGAAGPGAGAAYLFDASTGAPLGRLLASDGAAGDDFGSAVALDGPRAVVTARLHDEAGPDSGAAYVFDRQEVQVGTQRCFCGAASAPCGNPDAGAGCANSTGVGAAVSATGSYSASSQAAHPLTLHATQARPNKNCIWLQGATQQQVAFKDGDLCVGDPTIRLPGFGCGPFPIGTLDASGALSTDDPTFGFDVVAAALCKGDDLAAAAPTTRDYQLWYRDGMGPCGSGSNLTNAISIDWVP